MPGFSALAMSNNPNRLRSTPKIQPIHNIVPGKKRAAAHCHQCVAVKLPVGVAQQHTFPPPCARVFPLLRLGFPGLLTYVSTYTPTMLVRVLMLCSFSAFSLLSIARTGVVTVEKYRVLLVTVETVRCWHLRLLDLHIWVTSHFTNNTL